MPRLNFKAAVAGACLALFGISAVVAQVASAPATPTEAAPPAPPPGVRLAPGQAIPAAELEAYVDGVVAGGMASDHIAGVTVSVVQNGQVLLKKGYGVSAVLPAHAVDPDRTLFRLGSISKTFTWIAAMKEVEAGRMRLDGPINLYLPEALQVKDQGYKRPVLLRDLMTHTPGFEDRALGQLFERDPARVRPLAVYLKQERPRRVREPGTTPSYSNYGVALVGEAVSNVTGKPFENLVEDEIIRPLGLSHTTFREPRPARADLPAPLTGPMAHEFATPYRWADGGFQGRDFEFMGQVAPAGALSSTAGDMGRYMLMLLGGGTLDGVTVYNPQTAAAFSHPLSLPLPGATGWNAGFQQIRLPGGVTGFGHFGDTLSFHSGLVIAPSLGLGVFISTNTDTGDKLAKRLPEKIVERFYAAPQAPPAPNPDLYAARALYEGTYLTSRRAFGRLEGFIDMFIAARHVKATHDGYLSISSDEGVRRWAPVGAVNGGVFQAIDGPDRIVFDLSGGGRASRFIAAGGGATLERAGPLFRAGLLTTLTVLAVLASIFTLVGLGIRDRRDFRETQMQGRASMMQTTQAVLTILAVSLLGLFAMSTGDIANVVYNWPDPFVVTASTLALVSYVLSIVVLVLLPFVWRGGRRVDSWTGGRKLRFTLTALIFFAFGSLLGVWGAILPWVT